MTTNDKVADYAEPSQLLPEGRTCRDCRHYDLCEVTHEVPAGSIACEWVPSRFRLAVHR